MTDDIVNVPPDPCSACAARDNCYSKCTNRPARAAYEKAVSLKNLHFGLAKCCGTCRYWKDKGMHGFDWQCTYRSMPFPDKTSAYTVCDNHAFER